MVRDLTIGEYSDTSKVLPYFTLVTLNHIVTVIVIVAATRTTSHPIVHVFNVVLVAMPNKKGRVFFLSKVK
jgi:hypothetical protein